MKNWVIVLVVFIVFIKLIVEMLKVDMSLF
jgi:hypothetical protein